MSKYYLENPQLIDIEKVVRGQKNKIVKNLPSFLIKYLKKIVRQDELNDIILNSYTKEGFDFFRQNLNYMNIKIETENLEDISPEGRYIFVANHVLGGIDGIAVIVALSEKFPKVKTLANEILMTVKNAQDLFLPVNVFSKNTEEAKRKIQEAYASQDIQIVTFPSGEVARKYKGKLDDGLWHRSFIRNAVENKRKVVPVYIVAQNSEKFYTYAKIRRNLRIKANIELFLLPQELLKQKGKTVKIIFGKPIEHTFFNQSKDHLQWAQEVKKITYSLYYDKQNLNEIY